MKKFFVVVVLLILAVYVGISGGYFSKNSAENKNTQSIITQNIGTISIPNEGGDAGGHTPRGFEGQGTGIFVGDNLNPNFPNGDGVQAFITFDLGNLQNKELKSAKLISTNLKTRGTPFEDLGDIIVDEVVYNSFSSKLWDLNAEENGGCTLRRESTKVVSCNLSSLLKSAIDGGKEKLQLRLKFETISNDDGLADLALFSIGNSNQNDRGLFSLEVLFEEKEVEPIAVGVVLHIARDSGEVSSQRSIENIEALFSQSKRIWEQADVFLDVEIVETQLNKGLQNEIKDENFSSLLSEFTNDNRIHIYFVRSLGGINGITLGRGIAAVADITTVHGYRATAHEIGHLLGLGHTPDSMNRLMFQGANGEELIQEEINTVRGAFE